MALGYGMFRISGFGANIVALPLLVQVVPLRMAVPLLLLLDLLSTVMLGAGAGGRCSGWNCAAWCLPAGGHGRRRAAADPRRRRLLLGVLGGFLVVYAAWSLWDQRAPAGVSRHWADHRPVWSAAP